MTGAAVQLAPGGSGELSDSDAVSRILAGDQDLYAVLVRRHQRSIYRHARGMGLDHDTALDLVQDAFVRAYDNLADCQNRERFAAWLSRIARNLCLDHLKNVRRQVVPLSSVTGAGSIADERSGVSESSEILHDALSRLSTPLREAFLLKHAAGYTYDEVAQITDATPSAAKMRVHRAREILRELLSDDAITAA